MLIALAHIMAVGPRDQTQAFVMLSLADHADQDGVSWPSIDTIAHEARTSRSSAIRALSSLVDAGWLLKSKRHHNKTGSQLSNRYRINLVRLERLASEAALGRKLRRDTVAEFGLFEDELATETGGVTMTPPRVTMTPPPCHHDTPRGVTMTPKSSTETPKESLAARHKIDVQSITAFQRDEILAGRSVIVQKVQVLPNTGLSSHLREVLRK